MTGNDDNGDDSERNTKLHTNHNASNTHTTKSMNLKFFFFLNDKNTDLIAIASASSARLRNKRMMLRAAIVRPINRRMPSLTVIVIHILACCCNQPELTPQCINTILQIIFTDQNDT